MISIQKEGDKLNQSNELIEQKIISSEQFSSYYTTHIFERMPLMMGIICSVLVLFSFVLWRILILLQRKSSLALVKDLESITDAGAVNHPEPVFEAVYEKLNQRFEGHMTDYKRLHSYLSHEQKNLISILRAELEVAENPEHLVIIDRISDSIDDILTLSETIQGADTEEVDVSLICAEICDSYKNISAEITFLFDEDQDHTIMAKERWIYRAVSNLMDNAVKYGDDQGIEVFVSKKNKSVIVRIHDYGVGMTEEETENIFAH